MAGRSKKRRTPRIAGAVVSACDAVLVALAIGEFVEHDTAPLTIVKGAVSFVRLIALKFAAPRDRTDS